MTSWMARYLRKQARHIRICGDGRKERERVWAEVVRRLGL